MSHNMDKKLNEAGKFDKVPKDYHGTVYTCPMHPEVRDIEDSSCPICGMALKPEDEIANSDSNEHSHTKEHAYGRKADTDSNDVKSTKGAKYDKVPENYTGTVYICPMHPEIRDVEKSDCPICGMFLESEDEVAESNSNDDSHANCHGKGSDSGEVKSVKGGKYDKVPADYDGTIYTCPMHPEVRDVRNSGCPICGMGLEPETITAGEEDTEELDDMTRRFWICTLLTLPLFIYAMSDMVGINLDQIGSFDISGQLGQIN